MKKSSNPRHCVVRQKRHAIKIERLNSDWKDWKVTVNRTKPLRLKASAPFKKSRSDNASYSDAIRLYLPRSLKHLISCDRSPFYMEKIKLKKPIEVKTVRVPRVFSILKNPKESYDAIRDVVTVLISQGCRELWIDYRDCIESDLLTQIFLDSILREWDIFETTCKRTRYVKYLNVNSLGGSHYNNEAVSRLVHSVGSPVVLLNKQREYDNVISFPLRYFDNHKEDEKTRGTKNEIDSTQLCEYVNECLGRVGKALTNEAMSDLGTVVSEALINASDHSSCGSRYLIGYFEDVRQLDQLHSQGVLNVVILNYGQSIYEKFKFPFNPDAVNQNCVRRMEELSANYTKNSLFSLNKFRESTLWTLYALQQGVSSIPNAQRGNGTVKLIDKFFNLREQDVDNESRMFILSGDSIIEFDGTYRLHDTYDSEGLKLSIMSFNDSGNLSEKPDERFVRHSDYYFPGTAICARISLNSSILKDENN